MKATSSLLILTSKRHRRGRPSSCKSRKESRRQLGASRGNLGGFALLERRDQFSCASKQMPTAGRRCMEACWRILSSLTLRIRFRTVSRSPGWSPGIHIQGQYAPAEEFRFRQRMGGVVGKRARGRESFAHGPNADRVVAILKEVRRGHPPVSKIYVNQLGHAFWREEGVPRFITVLDGKLEFPVEV